MNECVCVFTSTILCPTHNKLILFLTLFSQGLHNRNKSGTSHKITGNSESSMLVSHLRNGIHVFCENSETMVDGHCISIAFVFNRLSSQRRVRSMDTACRNFSHKIYLSSEKMKRNIFNKKVRWGGGMEIGKRGNKRSSSKTE